MKIDFYDEDCFVSGAGGSGKTYLIVNGIIPLLKSSHTRFWFWDTRHQYKGSEKIVHEVKDLPVAGSAVIQPYDTGVSNFDRFCAAILLSANTVAIIDEIQLYVSKFKFRSPSLYTLATTGRNQGNTIIAITRRPQMVHNDLISDSDHLFLFNHMLPGDYEFLKRWAGEEYLQIKNKPQHAFFYYSAKSGERAFLLLRAEWGKVSFRKV